jgi:predicted transcriptional regulator
MTLPDQPEAPDSRLRHLAAAGLSTYKIADMVNLSQSAVSRRLRKMAEEERLLSRIRFWQATGSALAVASLMVIAAAVASIAWGG